MMRPRALRQAIVAAARRMNAVGLNQGTSGNVSGRSQRGMLITPSGMPYDRMTPEDIVEVTFEGEVRGLHEPSSEWPLHLAIYLGRSDAEAIVHVHAPFCTALACVGSGIPAFHYMVAVAGGVDIRCAPYATFGGVELAEVAVRALEGRRACLLENHGMVAFGRDPAGALALAVEVEALAAQYSRALQVGKPKILSEVEMATILKKFGTYGQNAPYGYRRV